VPNIFIAIKYYIYYKKGKSYLTRSFKKFCRDFIP